MYVSEGRAWERGWVYGRVRVYYCANLGRKGDYEACCVSRMSEMNGVHEDPSIAGVRTRKVG